MVIGLAGTLMTAAWQFLTVRYVHAGNWTALYMTDLRPVPAALVGERIATIAGQGFDGKFYHYIAHDPLLKLGLEGYVDLPGLRYLRILVPGLAHVFALGKSGWIDRAYLLVVLGFIFLGGYWLSRFLVASGYHAAWGLSFSLVPAVIVSADRMTVDVALAALSVGFIHYLFMGDSWKLYLILLLAPLARETGLILPAAYCLSLVWRRQWVRLAAFSTALIPFTAWYCLVHAKLGPLPSMDLSFVPLLSIVELIRAQEYASLATKLVHLVALLGTWLACLLALVSFLRNRSEPVAIAGALYALAAALLLSTQDWFRVQDFGRVFSPFLLLLGMEAVAEKRWHNLLPICATVPAGLLTRGVVAVQIVRGLFGVCPS